MIPRPTLLLLALAAACGPAAAQVVSTNQLTLRDGASNWLTVDSPFCAVDVTAQAIDPHVELAPYDPVTGLGGWSPAVTFPSTLDATIFARVQPGQAALGPTTVEICWTPSAGGCAPDLCGFGNPVVVLCDPLPAPFTHAGLQQAGQSLDPVNTFTGELFVPGEALLSAPAPLPIELSIYHAGRLATDQTQFFGTLGPNWTHSYEWRAYRYGNYAEIVTDRGRVLGFQRDPVTLAWVPVLGADEPWTLRDFNFSFLDLTDHRTNRVYRFQGNGRLDTLFLGPVRRLRFAYLGGVLSEVRDFVGHDMDFAYDAQGRLAAVTQGARAVTFAYLPTGELGSWTDADGQTTSLVYDPGQPGAALLTDVVRPLGNTPYAHAYDPSARVSAETDGLGNTWTFDWDSVPGETAIADPVGTSTVHVHDAAGRLVERRDEVGNAAQLAYDGLGRLATAVDRRGGTTTVATDPASGRVGSVTRPDGTSVSYGYQARTTADGNPQFDLVTVTGPDGAVETRTRDAAGNVATITDPGGNTVAYTYDVYDQPTTATNDLGGTWTTTYDARENPVTVTGPAGGTTTRTYDAFDRVVQVTWADGNARTRTFDDVDRVTAVTDELGDTTAFAYDANGRLATRTDPLGGVTSYGWDALDRPASRTDPLGGTATVAYDARGLPTVLTDAAGVAWTLAFGPARFLASVADGAGGTTTFATDPEGALTAVTDPLGNTTTFANDALGRWTALTTPAGRTVQRTLDAAGRPTKLVDSDGGEADVVYEARGLPVSVSTPEPGVAAAFAYDALGNVTSATDPGGNVWTWTWDAEGRLTGSQDPNGDAWARTHDARGLVTAQTAPDGGTEDLTHDAAGRVVRIDYFDPALQPTATRTFTWDALGRPTDSGALVWDAAGRLVGSNGLVNGFDAAGRLTSVELAPGKVVTYAWDAAGRLATVSDWLGGTSTFTRDARGDAVALARPNGVTTTWTWDADGLLVGIDEGALTSIALFRDATGRVESALRTGLLGTVPTLGTESWTHDGANRAAGATWDPLGTRVADAAATYQWDRADRLVSWDDGSGPVTFAYDAFGLPTARTAAGVTEDSVWNHATGLPWPMVLRSGGADAEYRVVTPAGELLYTVDAQTGARTFHHFDEAGNTVLLTDDAGVAVGTFAYDPYGRLLGQSGPAATRFTFGGRLGVERDGHLYRMRRRLYDPKTASFLSRDPRHPLDPVGLNRYAYARGNPVSFADPDGLTPIAVGVAPGATRVADMLVPRTQSAREAARRMQCKNNIRQMAIAAHNHHDVSKRLPPGVYDPDWNSCSSTPYRPMWSELALLLPYLEGPTTRDKVRERIESPVAEWRHARTSSIDEPLDPDFVVDIDNLYYDGEIGPETFVVDMFPAWDLVHTWDLGAREEPLEVLGGAAGLEGIDLGAVFDLPTGNPTPTPPSVSFWDIRGDSGFPSDLILMDL